MKRYETFSTTMVAFTIVFLSFSAIGYSQSANPTAASSDKPDTTSPRQNLLKPDTWALQFGIASNFTLTSFQGSVLSIKRQLNSHEAIQLGIGGSLANQNSTSNSSSRNELIDTLTYGNSGSGTNTGGSVQVNLQYVYYLNPDADVNIYVGVGPTIGYSRTIYKYDYIPVPPAPPDSVYIYYPSSNNQSYRSWNAGVTGMLGAECFILKFLSVHAQYRLNITYNESNSTYSSNGVSYSNTRFFNSSASSQSKSHGWQLNPNSVLFGLSVYFK